MAGAGAATEKRVGASEKRHCGSGRGCYGEEAAGGVRLGSKDDLELRCCGRKTGSRLGGKRWLGKGGRWG